MTAHPHWPDVWCRLIRWVPILPPYTLRRLGGGDGKWSSICPPLSDGLTRPSLRWTRRVQVHIPLRLRPPRRSWKASAMPLHLDHLVPSPRNGGGVKPQEASVACATSPLGRIGASSPPEGGPNATKRLATEENRARTSSAGSVPLRAPLEGLTASGRLRVYSARFLDVGRLPSRRAFLLVRRSFLRVESNL